MEEPMSELRSTATVQTDRSERWIKQLASHLGRKAEVREEADGAQVLVLAGGSCRMSGDDAVLRFAATAPDEEALHRVEGVVGGHLERFASAEGLVVRWERGA
jgi:uncharacterized protein